MREELFDLLGHARLRETTWNNAIHRTAASRDIVRYSEIILIRKTIKTYPVIKGINTLQKIIEIEKKININSFAWLFLDKRWCDNFDSLGMCQRQDAVQ